MTSLQAESHLAKQRKANAFWLAAIPAAISAIPNTILVSFVIVVLILYRTDIRRILLRVSDVEAFGVKLTIHDIEEWVAKANSASTGNSTPEDVRAAMQRAESIQGYHRADILWADDHPEHITNRWAQRALKSLGANVTVATSNEEASDRLRRQDFQIIISDLGRDNRENPREVINDLRQHGDDTPVVYYLGKIEGPTPAEAFGMTNRPGQLLDLISDVLDRDYWNSRPE